MESFTEQIDSLNREAGNLVFSSPEQALLVAEKALEASGNNAYTRGQAEAHFNLGRAQYYLSRIPFALASQQKALQLYADLGDALGKISSLRALGDIYKEIGRFERAMDFYTQSIEEARRAGDRRQEALNLRGVGEVCLALGEVKEALDYFLRSYETVPEEEDLFLLASILQYIGSAYHRLGNTSLARDFAEKALEIARVSDDLQTAQGCLQLLGQVYQASERPELAHSHFERALELSLALKNDRCRASVLLDLGSLEIEEGQLEGGIAYLRQALDLAQTLGTRSLLFSAYERMSEALELKGEYKLSLDYYKKFSRFEHEVLNEDASRKVKNITLQYEIEKSFQESEIYRLKNIELKGKTEKLEAANRQILAMAETGRLMTASLDLDTIINTLYETLRGYLPLDMFGLALYNEEDNELEYRAYLINGKRMQRSRIHPDPKRSLAAVCLRRKETVFLPDSENIPEGLLEGKPVFYGERTGSVIFLPLVIDDRALGLFTAQCRERGKLTDEHLKLVEALAPYVAIAVENSLIHDRLEAINRSIRGEKEELEREAATITKLAYHDPLTGLPNRRLLFELLRHSFDNARREGSKVGVVYLDLDDFKPINDRFGHQAGDRALIAIAERLKSVLRSSDTVARVGGDEFVAVIPSAKDADDIQAAARKLLEECTLPFKLDEGAFSVGISVGIAIFPDDGQDIDRIVSAADEAMYKVKKSTKNGLAFASSLSQGSS